MRKVANACVKEQWKTQSVVQVLRYKLGKKVGRQCQQCGVIISESILNSWYANICVFILLVVSQFNTG